MNPKKKAEELIERFEKLKPKKMSDYSKIYYPTAIQCALICVDEILEATKKKELRRITSSNPTYKYVYSVFWKQVKQELNKL